jgi:hypothetical protein
MRIITTILVLAAMAVSTAVVFQWRALRAVEFEATALREESRLKTDQSEQDASSREELDRLRQETQDLLKLRNQVRQLRSQSSALAQARAENARLRQMAQNTTPAEHTNLPVPEGFIARETLADAGLGTPEATVQSFFRAMRDGDVARFVQCASAKFRRDGSLDQMSSEKLQEATFKDFKIVDRNDLSPDKVVLSLRSSTGTPVMHITLRRFGNEWLVEKPY